MTDSTHTSMDWLGCCPTCGGSWAAHEQEFKNSEAIRTGQAVSLAALEVEHLWVTCVRGHRFEATERMWSTGYGIRVRGLEAVK